MTSASPWSPTYDFAGDPAPVNLINAGALQSQLFALAGSLAALYAALDRVIRDDDTLVDELVRLRNLHPELRTYLDSSSTGSVATNALFYNLPVRAASTVNLASLVGAQTLDGVALVSGDRALLKNQTIASQNGLWIVREVGDPAPNAGGLWTRAPDLPPNEPSGAGWAVCVSEGTLNGQTAWMALTGGTLVQQPIVGVDPLAFMPVFAPFPLPIARGGTGATTAVAARAAIGAPGKQTAQITGDGATTVFAVAHTLATALFLAAVQENATGEQVEVTMTKAMGTLTLTFITPPTPGVVYDVILVG